MIFISVSLSISIASGVLTLRVCRLDHLSVCAYVCACMRACVCVSRKCIVAKRLMQFGMVSGVGFGYGCIRFWW